MIRTASQKPATLGKNKAQWRCKQQQQYLVKRGEEKWKRRRLCIESQGLTGHFFTFTVSNNQANIGLLTVKNESKVIKIVTMKVKWLK